MKRALALALVSLGVLRALTGVLVLAAFPLFSFAAPTWTASTWTWGEFSPVANNLIAGINTTPGNSAILTDGVLAQGSSYALQIGNNASYSWALPGTNDVREVRIFTTWNDTGRINISIASVVATLEDGTTATLSPGAHSNTLRVPSSYPFSSLKDSTGALLAQNVTAITVNFGTQQSSGVGYGEIEVVGTSTNKNYVAVSSSGVECDTPQLGSISGYGAFLVPRNESITATAPLSGLSDTMKWTLEGWTLTEVDAAGTVTTNESDAINMATCVFTPAKGCCYELMWHWSIDYKIVVAADAGLSASASVTWADLGDTVTISATEDTAPFFAWEGDMPAANKFDLSFTTTVTGPMTFTAKTPNKIYYVAPGGTGDGTSWAAAFGTIQAAVTAGSATNNVLVCVKEGGFLQTTAVTATGVGPLMIRGGYAGDGIARGGETVVARRDKNDEGIAVQCPVFTFSAATVILDSLVVSNGFSNSEVYGQGVAFKSTCTATVRSCRFVDNGNGNHSSDSDRYGGAVGADKGTLVITNCVFARNSIHGGGSNVHPVGGAVGANGATVTIRDSSFDRNYTQQVHPRNYGGGAIGLRNCPSVLIDNCTFTTNFARRNTGSAGYDYDDLSKGGPFGGTIYIEGSASAVIADCTVLGSWNNSYSPANPNRPWGGAMCFVNSTVALVRTVVYAAGESGYTSGASFTHANGSIDVRGGTLAMTNVLHGASFAGWILGNEGGAINAVNCTFAGARDNGDLRNVAYTQTSGSAAFRNCIFRDNAGGDTYIGGGTAPAFAYCVTQSEQSGTDNSTADPLFGDAVYFHPQSLAGRLADGWFSDGTWTVDAVQSPSIDAGDAGMPVGAEPQPNLYRINAGYDGGTAAASKSNAGSTPVVEDDVLNIFAYDATDLVSDGATVSADVASTGGGANPAVTVVWGTADAGTNAVGAWTHSEPLGVFGAWDTVSALLTECAKGKTYYRFVAVNEKGTAWSDPVKSFTIGDPPTLAYDTDANPVSHRYRESARINLTLDDGGMETQVRVVCWPASDETAVVTSTTASSVSVSGSVTVDLENLVPDTAYVYYAEAVNAMGTATLAPKTFTTYAALSPLLLRVDVVARGRGDGTSWSDATTFADAHALAVVDGDEIWMRGGKYVVDDTVKITGHPGLAIRGGFSGDGETRGGETVIERDTGSTYAHRIFLATASTVVFDSLTIANGAYTAAGGFGQGVGLYSACNATFTNCLFHNNGHKNVADAGNTGGAIGAQNGTLRVVDCTFITNSLHNTAGQQNPLGGAIGATGAAVSIKRCRFDRNWTQANHPRDYGGGALGFRSCTSLEIDHCTFTTNHAQRGTGSGGYDYDYIPQGGPYGGTIHVYATPTVISDCSIIGGWNNSYSPPSVIWPWGGTMFFQESAVALVRTSVLAGGDNEYTGGVSYTHANGSIDVRGGSLAMTNVLHAASRNGWALGNNGGTITVENCTFAGARGLSGLVNAAYIQVAGTATFRNCVVWGNAGGFVYSGNVGDAPTITYTDSQDGADETTYVISQDPKFLGADAWNYRIKTGSPCANAGDKTGIPRTETDLDGGRRIRGEIDLGCYESLFGGTFLYVR